MKDWQQTHEINMAVQTAEIRLRHADMHETLVATCNLMNIARGQSVITITPFAAHEVMSGEQADQPIGEVKIRLDKRQMEINAMLPQHAFDRLIRYIRHPSTRPAVIKVDIDEALAVSVDGDLRIEEEMTLNIADVSITLPLR